MNDTASIMNTYSLPASYPASHEYVPHTMQSSPVGPESKEPS
jgi:hypothetical protein